MSWEYVGFYAQEKYRKATGEILDQHIQGVGFPQIMKNFKSATEYDCPLKLKKIFASEFEEKINNDESFKKRIHDYSDALKKEADQTQKPGVLKTMFLNWAELSPGHQRGDIITKFLYDFEPYKHGFRFVTPFTN